MNSAAQPPRKETTGPGDKSFSAELVISDRAEVYLFIKKPLENALSWLEFNLDSLNLDFVMKDGDVRKFGAKVPDHMTKHMQNAFQVMMVLMDEKTGQPTHGDYFPLMIHRS